jgi:hypothetical protein
MGFAHLGRLKHSAPRASASSSPPKRRCRPLGSSRPEPDTSVNDQPVASLIQRNALCAAAAEDPTTLFLRRPALTGVPRDGTAGTSQ